MPATLSSSDGQTILGTHVVKIGRTSNNELVLKDLMVSAHHAEIRPHEQEYVIVDLGSTNGTFVNGQRLAPHVAHLLKSGDTIRIGAATFTYYSDTDVIRGLPPSLDSSPVDEPANPYWPAPSQPYSPPLPGQGYGQPAAPQKTYFPPPSPGYYSTGNYAPPSQPGSIFHPPSSKSILPEQLQFTAFHPKVVAAGIWHTLLVYAHIESALWSVRADAARFIAEMGPFPAEISSQAQVLLFRGTEITLVPACRGVIFGPERVSFKWVEDWHPTAFRFQADISLAGSAENGEIAVYAGPLLIATLKIAFLFEQQSPYLATTFSASKDNFTEISARPYKQIFTSYSHADTPIVLACRNAYKALGFQVLIDIDTLRSGQNWNAALLKLIDDSDIFQLFWSPRSAQSKYVRQEWQYALQHYKGEGFIRPVYWKKPLVPPPAELSSLHFAYVQLPKLRISDYGRLFSWSISSILRRDE